MPSITETAIAPPLTTFCSESGLSSAMNERWAGGVAPKGTTATPASFGGVGPAHAGPSEALAVAGFAHYDGGGGVGFKDHCYSSVVTFDAEWRRTGGWLARCVARGDLRNNRERHER